MALDVGLSLKIDPRQILTEWYPYQLCSVYAVTVNEKWAQAYSMLDDKERLKHPEVMVSRALTGEEAIKYKEQKNRQMAKILDQKMNKR